MRNSAETLTTSLTRSLHFEPTTGISTLLLMTWLCAATDVNAIVIAKSKRTKFVRSDWCGWAVDSTLDHTSFPHPNRAAAMVAVSLESRRSNMATKR